MTPVQARASTAFPYRLVALLAALLLVAFCLWAISGELRRVLPPHGLWDFGAFVASGRAAAEGLNPYGVYPPLTPHVVFPGFDAWNPNLNPPISALLFQLFDLAPPEHSLWVWSWISVALYAAAVLLLVQRYAPDWRGIVLVVWAFALAGFWDTLYLGQIYVPLVLAAVGAWLLLDRNQPIWAGILIGLVIAMKPNFLVWPVLLFLAGQRLPSLVSVLTAALVSAIPLAIFGPEIYRQWLELVVSDGERAFFLTNASISGLAARAGVPFLGTPLSAALLLALAAWAWFRKPATLHASALGLLAAVFASPLGWIHYTLFLLPVIVAYHRHWGMWVVAALLVVPVPKILGYFGAEQWLQFTLGSAYGWALVLCLVVLLFSTDRPDAADATPRRT